MRRNVFANNAPRHYREAVGAQRFGDRPQVRPTGTTNIAFIGQYCESPDDVVFTVEYSVRSAQIAAYSLLGLDKKVSPLYEAQYDLGVLFRSLKTLMH
jgi:oleate hydratase